MSELTLPSYEKTKFCKHCAEKIHFEAVVCNKCGLQVEELKGAGQQPTVIVNNSNVNTNTNTNLVGSFVTGRQKSKWVALALCIFLGYFGGHKFYEGRVGMGILYFFTGGLFFIGIVIDFIALLFKPDPYYV
ncbi:TM2 domain-containing protein [Paenibacillus sp. R14(2021)]|uniref:TM2 domain-containing protein n=1 Tax=Paenibacillus sp. R14(2021) TaxID=2859228 RepID=UPI00215864B2|nr:TM2 domain-containing protein [Paenibacillus sp. R14(2021)]